MNRPELRCTDLESERPARVRGFESLRFRQTGRLPCSEALSRPGPTTAPDHWAGPGGPVVHSPSALAGPLRVSSDVRGLLMFRPLATLPSSICGYSSRVRNVRSCSRSSSKSQRYWPPGVTKVSLINPCMAHREIDRQFSLSARAASPVDRSRSLVMPGRYDRHLSWSA
jgi:hypothetical protein